LIHEWIHSVCNLGGRISVCMTTQYCSVFSRKLRKCSAVAWGARISKAKMDLLESTQSAKVGDKCRRYSQ
jgi:hypothetical protein